MLIAPTLLAASLPIPAALRQLAALIAELRGFGKLDQKSPAPMNTLSDAYSE